MTNKLNKQYNNISKEFSARCEDGNKYSNQVFYDTLRNFDFGNKRILDLGCGNGLDMEYYHYRFGKNVIGVDASEKMVTLVREKGLDARIGTLENIPLEANSIDAVLSKYAIQTLKNLDAMYSEVSRILSEQGLFIFLVVHPIRQFYERKTESKNYFQKTNVESKLFDGTISVVEPTHTFNEYFSKEFFRNFELVKFIEKADFYSAEKIKNENYPTYMIVVARKK